SQPPSTALHLASDNGSLLSRRLVFDKQEDTPGLPLSSLTPRNCRKNQKKGGPESGPPTSIDLFRLRAEVLQSRSRMLAVGAVVVRNHEHRGATACHAGRAAVAGYNTRYRACRSRIRSARNGAPEHRFQTQSVRRAVSR